MIFDPDDELGAHALKRLSDDKIGWLTTVTPAGQPQTMPIWFLWVAGELLVYGDHRCSSEREPCCESQGIAPPERQRFGWGHRGRRGRGPD